MFFIQHRYLFLTIIASSLIEPIIASASSFYQTLVLLVLHAYVCEICMTKLKILKNCSASFFYQILVLLVLHAYVCEIQAPPIHSPTYPLSRKMKKNRVEGRIEVKCIFTTSNY